MRVEYVFFVVALCFVTGPSCSDAQSRSASADSFDQTLSETDPPGVSEWCTKRGAARGLRINPDCCTARYSCKWFVDSNQTRDGLENRSPYRRRNCDCEEEFYDCATNYRPRLDRLMIRITMESQMCRQGQEWVSGSTWLEGYVY